MVKPIDHYALLGIPRHAGPDSIRAAYVAGVKTCHPDFAATPEAFDRFHALQRAYECLRSPELRARYDAEIADYTGQRLRRIDRAQRRIRRLDRRLPVAVTPQPVPHWRAAVVVAASGSLVLSVCYILLR